MPYSLALSASTNSRRKGFCHDLAMGAITQKRRRRCMCGTLKQRKESRSKDGEAVRKIQLDNELRSIKLQRMARQLVPVDRVKKEWFELSRRVRDELLNLPSRLSGPFAAESRQERIFESFTREIYARS